MVHLTKILVLRLSAMGDVALLVPVLRSLTESHPNVEVTMVTRPRFAAFFDNIPRVEVFYADVDNAYSGPVGLYRLYRQLSSRQFDVVIDEHDHLRTKILRSLFRMGGQRVVVFEKGRKAKKAFSRKHNKIIRKLPHTVERYRDAFVKAGISFDLLPPPHFGISDESRDRVAQWLAGQECEANERLIGIAPFARHATKIWPEEYYSPLLKAILSQTPARFLFFGGGQREIEFFNRLRQEFPDNAIVVAGELNLKEEIALISRLDVMVCVDSSNMHIAALAGTPTVSIWGGTHPDTGFAPWADNAQIIHVSRTDLPCRPCSVYGRETCYVGGFPCLTRIGPQIVANAVLEKLSIEGTRK